MLLSTTFFIVFNRNDVELIVLEDCGSPFWCEGNFCPSPFSVYMTHSKQLLVIFRRWRRISSRIFLYTSGDLYRLKVFIAHSKHRLLNIPIFLTRILGLYCCIDSSYGFTTCEGCFGKTERSFLFSFGELSVWLIERYCGVDYSFCHDLLYSECCGIRSDITTKIKKFYKLCKLLYICSVLVIY